jgi:hypothetical protein
MAGKNDFSPILNQMLDRWYRSPNPCITADLSPTLFLAMDTTPLTAFPLKDRTLEATLRAKRGSAAEKPRRPRLEERREMEEDEEVGER